LTKVTFVCKKSFSYLKNFFLKIIMVSINFCPPAPLLTSGTTLDCKMFQQSMSGFPSDRHAYHLKCCMHPMRYCFSFFYKRLDFFIYFIFSQGRLPYQVKDFIKYIRLAPLPPSSINTYYKNYHIFF
jgi:hypothetical protein